MEIKSLELKDFEQFKEIYGLEKEWRKWDGPYFRRITEEELSNEMDTLYEELSKFGHSQSSEYIYCDEKVIGKVNWYYKSPETHWIEVGIRIMDENYWNKGLGTKIMSLWMTKVFERFPEITRLGFTTWSGNLGMMKIGEKLGLTREATYKNARILDGKYYDSVSFGVQRDEFWGRHKC